MDIVVFPHPLESAAFAPTAFALLIAVWVCVMICAPPFQPGKKFKTRMRELGIWMIVIVVTYVVLNAVVWCLSWLFTLTGLDDRGDRSLTTTMVTEEVYDFTSGKSYPTSIGEGNTEYLHLGVPGSGNATNLVAIPLDKIDFVQKPGAATSVAIDLNDSSAHGWADYEWQRATHETRVVWGWWTLVAVEHGHMLNVETDKKLPEIIAAEVEHVTITVTPAEYERIIAGLKTTE